MKRSPIQRKTPMGRGQGLGLGKGRLPAQKRLPSRSPKRKADMVERRALVGSLLAQFPKCQARWVCDGARSVDVHERIKRSRGGSILDPVQAHMITVCRACHEMTESHPAEATLRRLLLPSWHECPEVGPC